jgi:hypothetical protein
MVFKKGNHPKTQFKKGIIPWNKGKTNVYSEDTLRRIKEGRAKQVFTKESREKMGLSKLGKKKSKESIEKLKNSIRLRKERLGYLNSPETRKKISEALKGKPLSEETKTKMRLNNKRFWKGKNFSEEHKRKIKLNHLGNKGQHHTEATKEKLRSYTREKSSQWQGGISFEPYPIYWNDTLKRAIRQRDRYTCRICNREGWCVHHIDYDKNNLNSDNLITLCNKCHQKTNFNRDKWINYFKGVKK